MPLRRRALPRGWYPDDPEAVGKLVGAWTGAAPGPGGALAAISPHAGWAFSGVVAARAVSALRSPGAPGVAPPTVAVVGGHLPPGARPLAAGESAYETPLGPLEADLELLSALESALGDRVSLGADEEVDNSVEVLLPLVAAILPGSRALWLRAPNDGSAAALGAALAGAARAIGRSLLVLGSTDLTHYGPHYGFSPMGRGRDAESWVRDVNDRRFIQAVLDLDAERAVAVGEAERSACSSGAAAAALSFALASGASRAELLAYATSLDVRRDESFVGYGAFGFFA